MKITGIKIIYILTIILVIMATGCSESTNFRPNIGFNEKSQNGPKGTSNVSNDTLKKGDPFVSTGAAGKMYHKQGKIILIGASGSVMPLIVKDDKIIAKGLTDDTLYRIKKSGDNILYESPDSDKSSKIARMMLVTEEGEMLEVRLLGDQLVTITQNNMMLPLEKKLN